MTAKATTFLKQFFKKLFNIREGREDNETIIENIHSHIRFRGAKLWTLIFAILIASIGLNINSIAIIIGAMLISPLMGPILGFGLSLGINDSRFLRTSLKHFTIATLIGIGVSAIYFYLSPINGYQSELLSRISPTIYDVLVAFFGGLAGIIGSTRKEKDNVVPGVAIATALMPPLCTIGYGIATLQPQFIFGAGYLYAINCIFICLATFVGVKYLRLPKVAYVDEKKAIKTKRIIIALVIVMIVPAVYFAYTFAKENNFDQNVQKFVSENFKEKGYAVIYENIDYRSDPHKVELAFLSTDFSPEEISIFNSLLPVYGLKNTELIIKQGKTSLSEDEWTDAVASIKNESDKIKAIEARISEGFVTSDTAAQVLKEAKFLNNKIDKIAIGNLSVADQQSVEENKESEVDGVLTAVIYKNTNAEDFSDEEKAFLSDWIKTRMQNQEMMLYFL